MIKTLAHSVAFAAILITLSPQPAQAFIKEILVSIARSEAERVVRNGARDVIQGTTDMVTSKTRNNDQGEAYDRDYEREVYEQQARARTDHQGQYEQPKDEYIDGYGVARELPAQEGRRYETYKDYDAEIARLEAQKRALAAERNNAYRRRHAKNSQY